MKSDRWQGWVIAVFAAVLLIISVIGPGCCSSELQKQAQLSESRAEAFVTLMDAAQTERADEQDFIRACGEMFTAMRVSVGARPLGGADD